MVQPNNLKQRVLQECFIHAHDVRYVTHYLKDALRMCDERKNNDEFQTFVSFTQRVINQDTYEVDVTTIPTWGTYRLYCLLMWILLLPEFRSYMRHYDDPEKFDNFYHILDATCDLFLNGWRLNGTIFENDAKTSKLHERSVGHWVDQMRDFYMRQPKLTIVLPSSNPTVHIAQSDARPPPHGSMAKKRALIG